MKILHVTLIDRGGGGIALLRIHKSLLKMGSDSNMLVLYKTTDEKNVFEYNYLSFAGNKWQRLVRKIKLFRYERHRKAMRKKLPPSVVQFSFPETIYDITEHPLYKEADIIQLNWVSGFLNEIDFFRKNTKPVVWRMSDLYPCGGGNHYEKNFPYEAYSQYTEKNYARRKDTLKGANLHIVPISEWAKEKAMQSGILKDFPMTVIHNGIDTEIFRPLNKKFAREVWNFPDGKKVVLIGSHSHKDPRKGLNLFLEAISAIDDNSLVFYAFGSESMEHTRLNQLGVIKDERTLALLFSAVDYFVMPSIEDTFGQVFIECVACGTPVVGFPNGGGRDVIRNGFNGVLTDDFTAVSLCEALIRAFAMKFNNIEISKDAVARFNIADKAREFYDLYTSVLSKAN
jgi:glycosyltransferase involved in cell wall biosynthesis